MCCLIQLLEDCIVIIGLEVLDPAMDLVWTGWVKLRN